MTILRPFIVGVALFLFPGYALLVVLRPRRDLALVEMLCAAGGLSLAVVPGILYGSTFSLGKRLTPIYVVVFIVAAGGICIWDWIRRFLDWQKLKRRTFNGVPLLLGIVFLMTLSTRLFMVRDINYPLWTDSYHHTLITQLIVDTGKVPSSYAPYAPIDSFTYHFGFHALAAWFHWLSGVAVPRSVVLVGQVINALAALTVYLFTRRLFGRQSAGLVAALIVGLVAHIPTFFVNWGRYPQLDAQVLLPVVMVLFMDALNPGVSRPKHWLLVAIGVAGLLLIHIRIFLFFVLFAICLFVWRAVSMWPNKLQVKRLLVMALIMGSLTFIIVVPWLIRFLRGFGSIVIREVSTGYQAQRDAAYFRWRPGHLIAIGMHLELLILAALGGLWGLLRRKFGVFLLLTWLLSIFMISNAYLIGVTPLVPNDVSIILLYLPGAALIGYLASELIKFNRYLSWSYHSLASVLAKASLIVYVLVGIRGMGYTAGLIAPGNGFVSPADVDAMAWIRQYIPGNARFHISVHFWTPVVAHGLDAGYWIPLLAERQVTVPPEIYASDGSAEYMKFINQRLRDLLASDTPEKLWETMQRYDITHVYIGYRKSILDPDFFKRDPVHFKLVYEEGGVWIFETVQSPAHL